jgi:VanZ family protein
LKIESNFLRYHLPAFFWGLVIIVVMSIPANYIPKVHILGYDKIGHSGFFLLLGFLVYRSIEHSRLKPKSANRSIHLMLIIVASFGYLSELYQHFIPGRSTDLYDWIADLIGAFVSVFLIIIYNYLRNKKALGVADN